jgi:hypothetical protein
MRAVARGIARHLLASDELDVPNSGLGGLPHFAWHAVVQRTGCAFEKTQRYEFAGDAALARRAKQ